MLGIIGLSQGETRGFLLVYKRPEGKNAVLVTFCPLAFFPHSQFVTLIKSRKIYGLSTDPGNSIPGRVEMGRGA